MCNSIHLYDNKLPLFTFYGYLSLKIFDNIYSTIGSSNRIGLLSTRSAVNTFFHKSSYVVNKDGYLYMSISKVKTINKREYEVVENSTMPFRVSPFIIHPSSRKIVSCDWTKFNANYLVTKNVINIFCMTSNGINFSMIHYFAQSFKKDLNNLNFITVDSNDVKHLNEHIISYTNKYNPIAIINDVEKLNIEELYPYLEKYKIPLISIIGAGINKCHPYVYYFGPSIHQYIVNIIEIILNSKISNIVYVSETNINELKDLEIIINLVNENIIYEHYIYNDNICNNLQKYRSRTAIIFKLSDENLINIDKCELSKEIIIIVINFHNIIPLYINSTYEKYFITPAVIPSINGGLLYASNIFLESNFETPTVLENYEKFMLVYFILEIAADVLENKDIFSVINTFDHSKTNNLRSYVTVNNQLCYPFQILKYIPNQDIEIYKPFLHIINSITLVSNDSNYAQLCDFTYPNNIRNKTIVQIGLITLASSTESEIHHIISSKFIILLLYYNQNPDFDFYFNIKIYKIAKNNYDYDDIFEKLMSGNVHHVFYYDIDCLVESVIKYLEDYNMQLWYIGLPYNKTVCSPYIFNFDVTKKVISFFNDLHKMNKNIAVLYSEENTFLYLVNVIKKVFSYYPDTQYILYPKICDYNCISNILLQIPNGGKIVFLEDTIDLRNNINDLITAINDLQLIYSYEFYCIFDYVFNTDITSTQSIFYTSLYEYDNKTPRHEEFEYIFYNKYNIYSNTLIVIVDAFNRFYDLLTATEVNDLKEFQRKMLSTTFDTINGIKKMSSDFTLSTYYNVIEIYSNKTFDIKSTHLLKGLDHLDYTSSDIYCNFTESLTTNSSEINMYTIGFIFDSFYESYYSYFQNIIEETLYYINDEGGIYSSPVSYIPLFYEGDFEVFEVLMRNLSDTGVNVYFGYIRYLFYIKILFLIYIFMI